MGDWSERPATADDVIAALRLIMGREPADADEIPAHLSNGTVGQLRDAFLRSVEFSLVMRGLLGESQPAVEPLRPYAAALHLLRPGTAPGVEWRFEEPSLTDPVSQLCTAAQVREDRYFDLCARTGMHPSAHRKPWELCYIPAVLARAGLLSPGRRVLGFGCGEEPLPSFFAREGLSVLATDAPPEVIADQGWDNTGQHAAGPDAMFFGHIVPRDVFDRQVAFRAVDMNAIPADLRGFDACWSACALEHLGSIEHGLRFLENSLATLRPGGIAVHTTEFNLASDEATIEHSTLCLFRRQDIERLLARLVAAGHRPWALNLHPGAGEMDAHIDRPPYGLPHLKLDLGGFVTTSIGIVVERGPVAA